MSKKLFSGPKLRRLREQEGLSQTQFARALGISNSYLNQIENNQRPLSAAVLIKLSTAFSVNLQSLSDEDDSRLAGDVREAMSDPLFVGVLPDLRELRDVAAISPTLLQRFLTLYHAYKQTPGSDVTLQTGYDEATRAVAGQSPGAQLPFEEVRDYFWRRNNYVHEIDTAAEALHRQENFPIGAMEEDLQRYLWHRHGVKRVLLREHSEATLMRHYDAGEQTLYLSAQQPEARRAFHMAYQIGLLECHELMQKIIERAEFSSREADSVCRVGLANYFAGALLMPYEHFLREARLQRYDLDNLEAHYGVTLESVCHRLSTLQRPGHQGIPFFFVRVDMAGNISKRQSASGFHFARSGGACPLWNVHEAFSAPNKILTQVARMPDGKTYFCLARTVSKFTGGYLRPRRHFAIGLGCELEYAQELVYSTGVNLSDERAVVPIGPGCRLCEQPHCAQRAHPPLGRALQVDANRRNFSPYDF